VSESKRTGERRRWPPSVVPDPIHSAIHHRVDTSNRRSAGDPVVEPSLSPRVVHIHLSDARGSRVGLRNPVNRAERFADRSRRDRQEARRHHVGRDAAYETIAGERKRERGAWLPRELQIRNRHARRKGPRNEVMQPPFNVQCRRTLGPPRESEHPAVRRQESIEVPAGADVR
jgi:hypothetical protein